MTAQMRVPSGATSTLPTAPILRPSGSFAHPSTIRYGFGSPCADTVVATPRANRTIRTLRTTVTLHLQVWRHSRSKFAALVINESPTRRLYESRDRRLPARDDDRRRRGHPIGSDQGRVEPSAERDTRADSHG